MIRNKGLGLVGALALVAAAGCGSSSNGSAKDAGGTAGAKGTAGAGTAGAGTAGAGTAGATGTAGASTDGGTDASDGGALSLYDRLGGKAGLESFVKNVVDTKILTDADLKTFFFNQVATPIPAGHPSEAQIVVCFGRFVGAALMADTYPGAAVADATNTNTQSFTCRDMISAHRGAGNMLDIGSADFDKFVGYIAAALMPLVVPTATQVGQITMAEFSALATALTAQKAAVTTTGAPDGGVYVPTLYDRLGGKSGLEMFVKTVVDTKILTDADLKTFFFNQVATPIPAGHPSEAQIVVCFGRFVGAALGADIYPGAAVVDATNANTPNFTCRDMMTAHQGASTMLHIGGGTFDKFVGYIAASLMPLVVTAPATPTMAGQISMDEFTALATALTSQKPAIVTAGASATLGPYPN
ncbi:MAG TPA: hypothetical protein VH560_14015 [Polyangia bacterium]|nr:hypothetical protein [Polyangia bacterium]